MVMPITKIDLALTGERLGGVFFRSLSYTFYYSRVRIRCSFTRSRAVWFVFA